MLIDEGDSIAIGKKELRGILDGGHCRGSAHVLRADGIFYVWCPKAIALIGTLPTTLRDRSIRVPLKRKLRDERVAGLDPSRPGSTKRTPRPGSGRAAQYHNRLAAANPVMPLALINRAADNFTPLLAIADAAGGRWPELARQMAVRNAALAGPDTSIGVMLLVDVRKIFRRIETDRIPTAELIMGSNGWMTALGPNGGGDKDYPEPTADFLRPYGPPEDAKISSQQRALEGLFVGRF